MNIFMVPLRWSTNPGPTINSNMVEVKMNQPRMNCPTAAMTLKDGKVNYNSEKCIGCGQCAYQCKQNNIELYPDERTVYLPILKKSEARINT